MKPQLNDQKIKLLLAAKIHGFYQRIIIVIKEGENQSTKCRHNT